MSSRIILAFSIAVMLTNSSVGQSELKSYQIFNQKGDAIGFYDLTAALAKSDVVLFGENHDNSLLHWLELKVAENLAEISKEGFIIGAEMFEADDQLIIDEYMKGWMNDKNFNAEAKLWKNYSTDYEPIVSFAKENSIPFIATNVPRRYAHMVAHKGVGHLDQLTPEAKKYMMPLPLEADSSIPGYQMLYSMSHGSADKGENFMYAQALKDATMAHFILTNRKKGLFLHFNGDYHSKNRGGIYWYLKKANKGLKVMTIAVVESDSLAYKPEYSDLADFIIVTPEDITRTY